MNAYYNEHDPFAAAWLRNLIAAGLIPPGDVDERDIQQVQPSDLAGYVQCHFFAGIGGWAYALQLAGWPRDRPVWTGSCPCQPYSAAGKGEGADDARNLWPHWVRLIRECRPRVVFGEQVEAAIRHGWLDTVSTDLEAEGYAFGACVLGAHSVGAPHIRQRVWFVADAGQERRGRWSTNAGCEEGSSAGLEQGGDSRTVADALPAGRAERRAGTGSGQATGSGGADVVGQSERTRLEGHAGDGDNRDKPGWERADAARPASAASSDGPWADILWLPCRDGKARPTKPGLFPLASGVRNRVGMLRGAGNSICPQAAAEVIGAYMEATA